MGSKPVCAVACFGEYDFVVVADHPNEVVALKAAGYAAAQGTSRFKLFQPARSMISLR